MGRYHPQDVLPGLWRSGLALICPVTHKPSLAGHLECVQEKEAVRFHACYRCSWEEQDVVGSICKVLNK